jgi:hypothetical protein
MSIDGSLAVAGAYTDDTTRGAESGSALVYARSASGAWSEQQRLIPSDGAAGDAFGYSVWIDGDTAIVGAFRDDTVKGPDSGSAYVFVRNGTTWTQQAQLRANDGVNADGFGVSVALDGDLALVGAYREDNAGGTDAGSAYVFVRGPDGTWIQVQKLVASDGAAADGFGRSVAVSGETLVVGASMDDTPVGADTGSVYVFGRSGGTAWQQRQKLTTADIAAGDEFGLSVAIDGNTLVAGAIADDNAGGVDAGAAYAFAFRGGAWTDGRKLLPPLGSPGGRFGVSVDVDGLVAIVGADMTDAPSWGTDAGSAFVFRRSGTSWQTGLTLGATDLAPGDAFGRSVAVDEGTALIGARSDDTAAGPDSGSVYVVAGPAVSAFTPASGGPGTTVIISGSGFRGATGVTFGTADASFVVVSDRRIDAVVPGGAAAGRIRVSGPLGSGGSRTDFGT